MRTREEQVAELVDALKKPVCCPDYSVNILKMWLETHIREAEERVRAECAAGYIFHSPDTGTEILPYHPVESGECTDATDIRLATADVLKIELLSCWEEMANSYREQVERGAECAADTRRLEWLADNQCQFLNFGPREGDNRAIADCMGNILAGNSDIRKAIDAAMEGGK